MHWIILLVSAVLEAVWATALNMSDGFSRPLPTVVFFVALTLSMVGLGYAMRGSCWGPPTRSRTGTGAALTVERLNAFRGRAGESAEVARSSRASSAASSASSSLTAGPARRHQKSAGR